MHTIEIDFEVFKKLTVMRETEAVTYNDVIRRLLGMTALQSQFQPAASPARPSEVASAKPPAVEGSGAWVVKNVVFPSGTEFRATHKGKVVLGRVEAQALAVGGKRYDSPSSAASAITGTAVNGWIFWECKKPGSTSWQMIKTLRKGS